MILKAGMERGGTMRWRQKGTIECPACASVRSVVDNVGTMLGERLCYVFRHFPLKAMHPHAEQAALRRGHPGAPTAPGQPSAS
ncbi:MAG TPA: hypothetical protein VE935_22365 [Burkholderiales bacterium]|nr:hypothetical protein [Burkholderiales bacterium]